MKAPLSRYSTVAIVLHWLIAGAIVVQMALGWRMEDAKGPAGFAMFQLHKSIGITILLLSLARLGWRLIHPAPPPLPGRPAWEHVASKIVHTGFYAIMIGLPLTGWALVSTSRTAIPTLLFGAVPWPHLPMLPGLAEPAKHAWHEASEFGHHALVYLTLALLFLHLGAVVKHQLVDRDPVLARMAPGSRPGWAEPRLWLVLAAALALFVGTGRFLPFPTAAQAPLPPPVVAPVEPAPAPPAPEAAVKPEVAAPETPAPKAAPAKWLVADGSTLGFTAAWSGNPIEGRFARWDADILFAPDALTESKLSATVDLASVSTGDGQRDASLASADWFDVAAHPRAKFVAKDFRKVGDDRFEARGTIDLHGVTRPLTVRFTLKIVGDKAIVRGSAAIDRTRFGVGQGEWASTDQIAAPVQVAIALTARRE